MTEANFVSGGCGCDLTHSGSFKPGVELVGVEAKPGSRPAELEAGQFAVMGFLPHPALGQSEQLGSLRAAMDRRARRWDYAPGVRG
jgi:hypothetical protein